MLDRIAKGLAAQFEERRIVVWTDPTGEMRPVFDALSLDGVTKIHLANNEFGVKYRVLRQEPAGRFLIYRDQPRPDDIDNWILDIELAHGTFKADQTAIWRTELGLPDQFDEVIKAHAEFFRSAKRLEQLKSLLKPTDTPGDVRRRMLAICANTRGDIDTVMEALLSDLSRDGDEHMRLITRVGLHDFLWREVQHRHGYGASQPSVKDFALWLFRSVHRAQVGADETLNADAMVFFQRWQNNRNSVEVFNTLSDMIADDLGIEADIAGRDHRNLLEANAFELVDQYLIKALVADVAGQRYPVGDVLRWVRERQTTIWYDKYRDLYQAIRHAAEFQDELARAHLGVTSFDDGITRYANTWFRIDQLYRKFILHTQRAAQPSLLQPLFEQIENQYVNRYLTRLNEAWQVQVDSTAHWSCLQHGLQSGFYVDHVGAFRRKDQRICVIISDALRYECAHELTEMVRQLDRYDAQITPVLGMLPSYTQLGMASLLPHKQLEIAPRGDATVLLDGQNTVGLEARGKLLNAGRTGDRGVAMRFEEFMDLNKDESRAQLSACDVLYIYHNQIDAIGDKIATEDRVFQAAETALDDIVRLVKKLSAANASNVIVTADHGFLYQHRPIEESDFSSAEVAGDEIMSVNRRFVLGRGLRPDHGLAHFKAARLGLAGDMEVMVPKSINRLRRQGSGSRFVHGGASLQEVVVPVVTISKKRQSDVSQVEVSVISANRSITAGQHAVILYQETAVSEKVRARALRVGLWSGSGTPISNLQTLSFELRSENQRERETQVRLLLSRDADAFNGEEVLLKLEEAIDGTSQFRSYKQERFKLQRSIATDFDF
ncbi:MAG: BREX-1 system phosphatase PglZ type A [Aquidulcibacter sp.]|jgi:uncharacterized protein (TIGR02687 family)|uniref:BREX-1 system phosphatase PglZ type A n=1 Tax=Aquidulcibacter sp. TaxID=2052990 RepID=UPI0022C375DF|nr:BREX-1 system phosphatase PglZ type A [Aquidulcibacter sp.]MCE2892632.1 BREX-1 system phosphatase PglZ type A [Hyphomonadaceae bacterium]MCZ8207529.1 BREX-1 system phosphatase PglZ type A [Aquidulcibacter sp.]